MAAYTYHEVEEMYTSEDPYDLSNSIETLQTKDLIPFEIQSEYGPAGDQENAIEKFTR